MTPNDPSTETLQIVQAIQSGASDRFDRLYERVGPALYAWARFRILASMRHRVDAQDVLQEVWARALTRFASFDPSSSAFRPWIFRIAKNVLLETTRRAHDSGVRRWAPGSTTKVAALGQLPDTITSFTTRLARDETIARFLALADSLEPADRELLVLHGLEGTTIREVAVRLDLSVEALKKRWQRLRARLQEQPAFTSLLAQGE